MNPKLGIALGSGGARGWAHIGVLGALAQAKLEPDIVCGTSIGAVIGAISLVLLAVALYALYGRALSGGWRATYIVTSLVALNINTPEDYAGLLARTS